MAQTGNTLWSSYQCNGRQETAAGKVQDLQQTRAVPGDGDCEVGGSWVKTMVTAETKNDSGDDADAAAAANDDDEPLM